MENHQLDKTPEQQYQEREKRVYDAIGLKVPDRVPIIASGGFFYARYAGITIREAMYDKEKITAAALKFLRDFQPDLGENPFMRAYIGSTSVTARSARRSSMSFWVP